MRHEDNQQETKKNTLDWMSGMIDGDGCVYTGLLKRKHSKTYSSSTITLDNGDPDILNHYVYGLHQVGINPHLRPSRSVIKVDVSKQAHLNKLLGELSLVGYKRLRINKLRSLLKDTHNVELANQVRSIKLVRQPKPDRTVTHLRPSPYWIGGVFDAEGCIYLGSNKRYIHHGISFSNQDVDILHNYISFLNNVGCSIFSVVPVGRPVKGRLTTWSVTVQKRSLELILCKELLPYLRGFKRVQLRALYEYLLQRRGRYTDTDHKLVTDFNSLESPTTLREMPRITGVKIKSDPV